MIIRDFFQFYFQAVEPGILELYRSLIVPGSDLAADYAGLFIRDDRESLVFLVQFYALSRRISHNQPEMAILFNVTGNICFPFFVDYIWKAMGSENRARVEKMTGCCDSGGLTVMLKGDVRLRNWFRKVIGSSLTQNDLFILNEVISLQNFSSGGEYSFLKYAYPELKQRKGRVLDAGCGSGFAALLISQLSSVTAVDSCPPRLARARAMHRLVKEGDTSMLTNLLNLIQAELGDISVHCDFPSAPGLFASDIHDISFAAGSLDCLPYPAGSFDYINCLDVLEHTYNPEQVAAEFSRLLRKGGMVLVTTPTACGELEQKVHESIEGTLFPAMLHLHHFDRRALNVLFSQAGFREYRALPFDYIDRDSLLEVARRSPEPEIIAEIEESSISRDAKQIFAIYERI